MELHFELLFFPPNANTAFERTSGSFDFKSLVSLLISFFEGESDRPHPIEIKIDKNNIRMYFFSLFCNLGN